MSDELARVFVTDRDADGGGADPGSTQLFWFHFRMAGECRAKHNCIRLAKGNLGTEAGLETIKKTGESSSIQAGTVEINCKQRRGRALAQHPLADARCCSRIESH